MTQSVSQSVSGLEDNQKCQYVFLLDQNLIIDILYNINTTIVSWNKKTYTKYNTEIGLALDEKKEVILNFPNKDCVLVGWMDKEDKEDKEKKRKKRIV